MPEFITSSKDKILVDEDDLLYLETQRVYVTRLPSDNPRVQIRLDGKLKNLAAHLFRRAGLTLKDGSPLPETGWALLPINGDWLDFRKSNLQPVQRGLKSLHARRPHGTNLYVGTSFVARTRNWRARIQLGHESYESAGFPDEKAAALAYDLLALRLHGHLAKLNFPERKDELVRLIGRQAVGAGIKTKPKKKKVA